MRLDHLLSKEQLARSSVFRWFASRATSRAIVLRWLLVSGALVIRFGLLPGSVSTPAGRLRKQLLAQRDGKLARESSGPSTLLGPEGTAASRPDLD